MSDEQRPATDGGWRPGAYAAGRPAQKSGSTLKSVLIGCLIAFFAGFAVVVLVIVAFIFVVFASAAGGAGYTTTGQRGARIQELTVSGHAGEPKVAMIPVRGVLMSGGSVFGADPAGVLRAMLDAARDDSEVRCIILEVDSPGGGITTSDIMHKAVQDFRKETGRPVVVLMEDMAASGAYYVSCAADHIMAHPTTITGSIGVMMPFFDASGLLKKVGVTDRTVKSGDFKDITSPFAERTPEQRERDKAVLSHVVDQMHDRFVQVVAEGRNLPADEVRKLADGRIYTADDALASKLIDSTGYEDEAIEKAKSLAGVTSAHVVEYTRVRSLTEMLLLTAGSRDVNVRLDGGLPFGEEQQMMYLWRPPAGEPLR